jgi:membrane-anchored protein YejM (alkaline phosphatase superfamily)
MIGEGQTTDRINHMPNFFHFNNRQSSLDNHQSDGKMQSGGLRTPAGLVSPSGLKPNSLTRGVIDD